MEKLAKCNGCLAFPALVNIINRVRFMQTPHFCIRRTSGLTQPRKCVGTAERMQFFSLLRVSTYLDGEVESSFGLEYLEAKI